MYSWQKVKLKGKTVAVGDEFETGSGEELISYCARVSNPSNQENWNTAPKLLRYCIKKKHWSVFEMADLIFEIETTRDIGRQILRHKSFSFQEFSQRYAEASEFIDIREARLQDNKNRQQSVIINDPNLQTEWNVLQECVIEAAGDAYKWALSKNIAKECARSVLPEGLTMSRMYMKGNIRNWFHYCQVRKMESETQREHVDIANKIWNIMKTEFTFLEEIETIIEDEAVAEAIKLLESKGYEVKKC